MKQHIPFPLWIDVYLTRSNSKTNQLLPSLYFSANVFLYPNNRLFMQLFAKQRFHQRLLRFRSRLGKMSYIHIHIHHNLQQQSKEIFSYILICPCFCFIYSKM
ncbi:hypothetical protein HanXRQr2_Chr09g0365651 [Helianthus annuus]|uniref:Uncharacterized protein n=1 Tax=Helianthus annuus TaxID=4232 RepID=A0A251TUH8_HELAN|nr:hypothetical protein HanXRQr2_Chr09g0365651 [Helianthus annuus]KAJ0532191.1 hypothetical protein HanIR_Chr09g0393971 [Helianthus annuus]KAJ0891322.1 hypothetical protein HanPSC8_Chr09g0352361 [Helianthus annuus]